ncbi:hypothetical protein [Enterococcus casseliflavus]|uniref:hypothetical protein n=1 Tax=Enterococcus casseliflavus TaxID=37734 RepID=UPI00232F97BE|nr:hypothetical protein [Enterococcus casseliflavus]MDB1690203.1 hypothetical protein [Enterococcus casseliflavus]
MKELDIEVHDNHVKFPAKTKASYTVPDRWGDVVLITGEDRDDRWIEDLEQLREAIYRLHPIFNASESIFIPPGLLENGEAGRVRWTDVPENVSRREAFKIKFRELIERVPAFNDMQIAFGVQQAIATLGDNHFNIFQQQGFPEGLGEARLPMTFMYFGGAEAGYYLVEAHETNTHVLNQRLVAVGDVRIEEVERRFADIWSLENIYNLRQRLSSYLSVQVMLEYMGLMTEDKVDFVFGNDSTISISSSLDGELVDGRVPGEKPAFMNSLGNRYYLLEDGILHVVMEVLVPNFQIALMSLDEEELADLDRVREVVLSAGGILRPIMNEDATSINDLWLGEEIHPDLIELVENNDIKSVLIDVRNNEGGHDTDFFEVFDYLAEKVSDNRRYFAVNSGSLSGSSAASLTAQAAGFTLIGEPTGQNTIFYGMQTTDEDDHYFDDHLNNSNLYIGLLPNALWHFEHAGFSSFFDLGYDIDEFAATHVNLEWYTSMPTILVFHTIEHWINNIDPILERIQGLSQ